MWSTDILSDTGGSKAGVGFLPMCAPIVPMAVPEGAAMRCSATPLRIPSGASSVANVSSPSPGWKLSCPADSQPPLRYTPWHVAETRLTSESALGDECTQVTAHVLTGKAPLRDWETATLAVPVQKPTFTSVSPLGRPLTSTLR
jgi:hypothetical protein